LPLLLVMPFFGFSVIDIFLWLGMIAVWFWMLLVWSDPDLHERKP
jgi:hypothetical protein